MHVQQDLFFVRLKSIFSPVQFWQFVRQELINRRNALRFNPRFFFRQQPSIFIHCAENGTCLKTQNRRIFERFCRILELF